MSEKAMVVFVLSSGMPVYATFYKKNLASVMAELTKILVENRKGIYTVVDGEGDVIAVFKMETLDAFYRVEMQNPIFPGEDWRHGRAALD